MKFLPEKTVVNFDTINQLLVADIKADVKKKFADRNHPWTEYELVCRAQAGLNALGFSPGSVNGKNNRRTQEAIRRFVDVWKKDRTISDIRIIVDDIESAVDAIDPNLGEWPMTQGDGVHP